MATNTYTAQPGDTPDNIAKNVYHDPSMAEPLKDAGVSNLLPGQEVTLPNPVNANVGNVPAPTTSPEFGNQLAQTATPSPNSPTPLEALPVVGQPPAPTYARPTMQGGQATFDIFNRLVSGQLSPVGQTPKTAAEQEAFSMYGNYKQYNGADAKTIYDAIQQGKITPDKDNLLWTSIYTDGEPTEAMVQAFGWWKTAQERNASQDRKGDPFLGGVFPKPTSIEDAERLINEDQRSMTEDGGDGSIVSGDVMDMEFSQNEMDNFADELRAMVNISGPAAPEYEKRLMQLRGEYNIDTMESELDALYKEYSDMEAITRQRLQFQEDQPVAMGVIAGRMTEVQRQQKERLDYLGREINYRNNMIQTANSSIEKIMNAKQLDYGVARQQWQDSVNAAKGMLQEFNAMRQQELDYVQAQKDEAAANLDSYYNLITEGVLDTSKISPQEMQKLAQLEMMAGMPVGTFMNLHSKEPNADVRTQVERYDAQGNRYFDMIMQDRTTGRVYTQTIAAGYDAEKALDFQSTRLDMTGKNIDNALGMDDLAYNRPLEREKMMAEIMNTESMVASRMLSDQKTSLDIASGYSTTGPSESANTNNYLANYGSITGLDGSPKWKWGLDVDLKKGDPVYSPVTGEVVKVGNNGGFGNQVQVKDSSGNTWWLSHLDGATVQVGQKVSAGAQVGVGGNSGDTIPGKGGDGSHLDITVKKSDGSYYPAREVKSLLDGMYKNEVAAGKTVTKKSTAKVSEEDEMVNYFKESMTSKNLLGSDGRLSPDVWNGMKTAWMSQGNSPTTFDTMFGSYINTKHKQDYNVGNTNTVLKTTQTRDNLTDTQQKAVDQIMNAATSFNK